MCNLSPVELHVACWPASCNLAMYNGITQGFIAVQGPSYFALPLVMRNRLSPYLFFPWLFLTWAVIYMYTKWFFMPKAIFGFGISYEKMVRAIKQSAWSYTLICSEGRGGKSFTFAFYDLLKSEIFPCGPLVTRVAHFFCNRWHHHLVPFFLIHWVYALFFSYHRDSEVSSYIIL